MLPFQNRLTKKTDFQKVYHSRLSFFGQGIILKATPNLLPQSRIGFSVEKKFFSKASERNQAKRRLREAVRPLVKKTTPGFDIVIIAKEHDTINNFSKLLVTVENLFSQANLLEKNN